MSVVKSKREESAVEFINTARELNAFTIRQCVKIPKRYTFYVGTKIADLASDIYDRVVQANSINPRNQHEAQIRRDLIILADAACESLIAKIGLMGEILGFEENSMIVWMELIENEQRLLKGVKKRDAEKCKDLPSADLPQFPVSNL